MAADGHLDDHSLDAILPLNSTVYLEETTGMYISTLTFNHVLVKGSSVVNRRRA